MYCDRCKVIIDSNSLYICECLETICADCLDIDEQATDDNSFFCKNCQVDELTNNAI